MTEHQPPYTALFWRHGRALHDGDHDTVESALAYLERGQNWGELFGVGVADEQFPDAVSAWRERAKR